MNKLLGFIIIFGISIFLIACTKDDSDLSANIFDKYESAFIDNGYNLNKVDASNNVSGWLEITDKDVVDIHRTYSEDSDGSAYLFLFPSIKKAQKWYDKIKEQVIATNYSAYLDGHYVIVVLGTKLNEIIKDLNG